MILQGRVHRFGDNLTTDDIIAGKHKHRTMDLDDLSSHIMENICANFRAAVQPGDFIVAGENFGCGSSREQAVQVIKHVGISAVVAKSFARIFFRNAINAGLLLLTCNTEAIIAGDTLVYDLERRLLLVSERDLEITVAPYPAGILSIVEAGGLLAYVRQRDGLW